MKESRLKIKVAYCSQLLLITVYSIKSVLEHVLGSRVEVLAPENMVIPRGTLIISNHQSKLDSLIVTSRVYRKIGLKNSIKVLPLRIPADAGYMGKTFWKILLGAAGAYNIGATKVEKAKGLMYTKHLIRQKNTVVLFPEGRVARDGKEVQEFQKGINFLIGEGTPVLLVRLNGVNKNHLLHIHRRWKKDFKISLDFLEADMGPEEKAKKISDYYFSSSVTV